MLDKHYTATTYLLEKNSKQTLLHWHEKLQTWLPPGGHIEKNETPWEAAYREIIEETGIKKLEIIENGQKPNKIDERAKFLHMPHFLVSELIEEGHYHLDWIFYVFIEEQDFDERKVDGKFKWYDRTALENEKSIFENVKKLAINGLERFYLD